MSTTQVPQTPVRSVFADFPTLARTVEDLITLDDLKAKLALGRPLRIKYGVDVTAPFLHIGHAVNLWAMRELQERGHKVIFLIGDFTTAIGDPTGKSKTRPRLDPERIRRDAEGFIRQVSNILLTDPDVFQVRRNSEWWSSMCVKDFLELLSLVTHARLIQRDMFQQRLHTGSEIYMHEMLYPVLQGYDSFALESDLTIVGTDQLFNEVMGRFYQERLGQSPQVVITTTITPGIDGREKQSKSLGNYIAVNDTPRDKYGKAMKLPDGLVLDFLRVYTLVPEGHILSLGEAMKTGRLNPMEAKKLLGRSLVERYHDVERADAEEEWFARVFSDRSIPEDIDTIVITDPEATLLDIVSLCMHSSSRSELRRLITSGGVRLAGEDKLTDPDQRRAVSTGTALRVGRRRWFRIVIQNE